MNSEQLNQNAQNYQQYQHQEQFSSTPFNINNNQQMIQCMHPPVFNPNYVVQNYFQSPYGNMRQFYSPYPHFNQSYVNGHMPMPMINQSPHRIQTVNGQSRQNMNQNLSKKTDTNKPNPDKTNIVIIDDDEDQEKNQPQIIKKEQKPIYQKSAIPVQATQYQIFPNQYSYYQTPMMIYQPHQQVNNRQAYNYQPMLDISSLPPKRLLDTNKQSKNELKRSQNFDSPSMQSYFSNPHNNSSKFKHNKPKSSVETLDIDFLEQKKLIYDPETSKKPNTRLQTKGCSKNISSDINGRLNSSFIYEEILQKKRTQRRKQSIWNQKYQFFFEKNFTRAPNIKTPMIGVNYQANIPLINEPFNPKFVKKFDHQKITEEQFSKIADEMKQIHQQCNDEDVARVLIQCDYDTDKCISMIKEDKLILQYQLTIT